MLFRVSHHTRYEYDEPVFLEPLTIRLQPRTTPAQIAGAFDLAVEPTPSGMTSFDDPEGNLVTRAWFVEKTRTLDIRVVFEVETVRTNPFDYVLLDERAAKLPMTYPEDTSDVLARYRGSAGTVDAFGAALMEEVGADAVAFLGALNTRLHEFRYHVRESGDPWPAEKTLAEESGSCRDLTVLFVEACRSVGMAARFVSGYQEAGEEEGPPAMHAWPEVYLSMAGWRGYDPSLGLAVGDGHVAVATAPDARDAAPTLGTYRGTGVGSRMSADIRVESRPSQPRA